jgi:hypothetical protein
VEFHGDSFLNHKPADRLKAGFKNYAAIAALVA